MNLILSLINIIRDMLKFWKNLGDPNWMPFDEEKND